MEARQAGMTFTGQKYLIFSLNYVLFMYDSKL
jgi:hypothetical protein